jgi:hypothetical protein
VGQYHATGAIASTTSVSEITRPSATKGDFGVNSGDSLVRACQRRGANCLDRWHRKLVHTRQLDVRRAGSLEPHGAGCLGLQRRHSSNPIARRKRQATANWRDRRGQSARQWRGLERDGESARQRRGRRRLVGDRHRTGKSVPVNHRPDNRVHEQTTLTRGNTK